MSINPMSPTKTDRRREKTRRAIRAAFFELLFERSFDDLTVSDVVERADIGRSTFYNHYKTKNDLLSQSLADPFTALAAVIGSAQSPETLVPLLKHFRDNHGLGRVLFLAPTRSLLSRALTDRIEQRLTVVCEAIAKADPIIPIGLMARQLAEAQLALIEPWMLGRVSSRAETVAAALFASTNGAASALLSCDLSNSDM